MADDDRGPWLSSATAIFFTWSLLLFLVRVWVKLKAQNWGVEDSLIATGIAVVVANVASTFSAINQGYGHTLASMSDPNRDEVEKVLYASQFFYVVAIGLSKVSTAFFIGRLTRYAPQVRFAYILAVVASTWTLASVLVIALRGNLARPWATLDGSGAMFRRWIGVEASGIAVEIVLMALAVNLVWGLKMAAQKRVLILAAFGCRLVLIPIVAVRLFYLSPSQNHNPTVTSIVASIVTQVAMQYSFMSASVTALRPFLRPFHSGHMLVDTVGAPGSGLHSGIRSGSQDAYHKLSAVNGSDKGKSIQSASPLASMNNDYQTTVTSPRRHSSKPSRDDMKSVDSEGSDQMIIRKTRDYSVRYEPQNSTRDVPRRPPRDTAHAQSQV